MHADGEQPDPGDALGTLCAPGGSGARRQRRVRRLGYALTSIALAFVVGLGALDAASVTDAYGVETDTVSARSGVVVLDVRYPSLSRAALASPFEITVTRAAGFDGPVRLAVDHRYLQLWDENGLTPAPSAETTSGGWVVWEFDPPAGRTLRVVYDARIEPGAHRGRSGAVALLDEDDGVVLDVSFTTTLRP